MVAQFIATRPIIDLCLELDRHPGVQAEKGWWEMEGVELAGIQDEAASVEWSEDDYMM